MKLVIYSYLFFLLANVLDVLSSLGVMEANPLMQHDALFCSFDHTLASCGFDLRKAIHVKLFFLGFYLFLSLWTWLMAAQINKKLAWFLAAVQPVWCTYLLAETAFWNWIR